MSHFTCLVVLPDGETKVDKRVLSNILAPYSENLDVEPYEVECYCKGSKARSEANEKAEKELGKTIQDFRDEYHNTTSNERPNWEEHIKPLIEAIDKHEKEHPLYKLPDVDCEDCHGTGIAKSTYNPNSKWDWYEIGGRWNNSILTKSGHWVNYASVKDIDFDKMKKNIIEKEEKNWEKAEGKDDATKYWEHGIEPGMTKEQHLNMASNFYAFSVVTQDGVWHERGKMGWWATVHDEEETESEWSQKFYERFIKDLNTETMIVLMDCHI